SGLAEADRLPQEQTDTGQPNGLVVALHRKAGHRCSYLGHFGMSGYIICVLHSKNLQADSESLDANHFIQDKSLRQPRPRAHDISDLWMSIWLRIHATAVRQTPTRY